MPIATVTSKGQITIPIEVRERLGIRMGTRVEFVMRDDDVVEFVPATRSIRELGGALKDDRPPATLDEIDDAIAAHVAEEDERSRR
jgi:antitoxin PrlF